MIAAALEYLRAGNSRAAVVRMLRREFHCTASVALSVLREAQKGLS